MRLVDQNQEIGRLVEHRGEKLKECGRLGKDARLDGGREPRYQCAQLFPRHGKFARNGGILSAQRRESTRNGACEKDNGPDPPHGKVERERVVYWSNHASLSERKQKCPLRVQSAPHGTDKPLAYPVGLL